MCDLSLSLSSPPSLNFMFYYRTLLGSEININKTVTFYSISFIKQDYHHDNYHHFDYYK